MKPARTIGLVMGLLSLLGGAVARGDLVFSTQPRGPYAKIGPAFEQVADYISKVSGEKVVYRHFGDWISYSAAIRNDDLDIVFDGPQFVAWRLAYRKHVLVTMLPPSDARHIVVVKKDNSAIAQVKQLAGRAVCGRPPPNLASLELLREFDNPARVPLIVEVDSYEGAYRGLMQGKCAGALMSNTVYEKLDKDARAARVVFTSKRKLPPGGFTVGPGIAPEVRAKIGKVLVSPDSAKAIKAFLDDYSKGRTLAEPRPEEYKGVEDLLKGEFGFEP